MGLQHEVGVRDPRAKEVDEPDTGGRGEGVLVALGSVVAALKRLDGVDAYMLGKSVGRVNEEGRGRLLLQDYIMVFLISARGHRPKRTYQRKPLI